MSETDEIYQVVRIMMDGAQVSLRIMGDGLLAAQKFVLVLSKTLEQEKQMGKTSMKRLLRQGGDVQVFQFPEEQLKTVEKMCKKYGILYSVLPDRNEKDGMTEILFHTQAMGRFRTIMDHLGFGRLISMEDYLQDEELEEELLEEQKERGDEKQPKSVEKLMQNLNCLQKYKDETLVPITVDESIVEEMSDTAFSFRIPGEYGKQLQVNRTDTYELKKDKTYLVFLTKEKPYPVFDRDKQIVGRRLGSKVKESFDDLESYLSLAGKEKDRPQKKKRPRNRRQSL